MSPPGRPEVSDRSAKHEAAPASVLLQVSDSHFGTEQPPVVEALVARVAANASKSGKEKALGKFVKVLGKIMENPKDSKLRRMKSDSAECWPSSVRLIKARRARREWP